MNTLQKYLEQFKALSLPGQLVTINIAVWLVLQLARLASYVLTGNDCYWEPYLALHAGLDWFVRTPWTLLTYFFVHANLGDNIFHLIFNMMWLWWFGQFFLRLHTTRQLLGVYLSGGLVAGVVFLLWFNIMPSADPLASPMVVGASGAIFALVTAVAVRQPDEPIYLNLVVKTVPVRMKWVALLALLLNILNLNAGTNTGGIVCHLGGMLFGLVFGLAERRGVDLFKVKPKMKATRGGSGHVPNDRQKDHDYNQQQHEHQQRVDAILDKISKSGYDGLTAEEKAFLFDASHRRKS